MKLKNVLMLLAAVMLLGSGCTIVAKPSPSAPAISVQETPAPTPAPTPEATPEPTPEATPEPTPELTPEPTPEATEGPAEAYDYRRGLYSFDDLVYERPDFDSLTARIEAIRAMVTDGTSSEDILAAYEALDEDFYGINNAYAIASLFSSLDTSDEYYSSEEELLAEKSSEMQVLATKLEIEIYESEHRDVVFYDWTEEDFENLRIAEKLYDDEYVTLNTRLEGITTAYWNAQTDTTAEYRGKRYTREELEELDIDENTYYSLLNDYYRNLNAVAGELYLELVSIEKRIAEKAGFDNYAEFAYQFEYERDYSVEDAASLSAAVKKYCVNELENLYAGLTNAERMGLSAAFNGRNQLDKRREYIEEYVQEISPDMTEAYHYLVDYQLSVLTDDPISRDGAYTTFMPAYDVPFIFIHEEGGFYDVTTFIHEFGHFYSNYLGGRETAYEMSLDTKEICSQANELLFLPYFGKFYKQDTYTGIVKYQMINALSSLIQGCLYDEFQQYVFSHDLKTVEEINEAYCEISRSYGMGDDYYYVDLDYVWVDVLHNFEVPMYYISYATSIVPALQVMELSLTDRQKAIDVYNGIVASDPEKPFAEVVKQAGLGDPFDEQTIADVVNAIVDFTGVGSHVHVN
jgi:M3 family oligoendopeptidase